MPPGRGTSGSCFCCGCCCCLSLHSRERGSSARLKGFAPSLQQKHPRSETSPPSICFSPLFVFARRNADLIGMEGMGMGRREARKGCCSRCRRPPWCFAGTTSTPVINELLGERKPLLTSQHLPLSQPEPLTHARGLARAALPRQASSDSKLEVVPRGEKKKTGNRSIASAASLPLLGCGQQGGTCLLWALLAHRRGTAGSSAAQGPPAGKENSPCPSAGITRETATLTRPHRQGGNRGSAPG